MKTIYENCNLYVDLEDDVLKSDLINLGRHVGDINSLYEIDEVIINTSRTTRYNKYHMNNLMNNKEFSTCSKVIINK
ncbi:MAG: hypothetical protein RR984_00970 [Bacilli bacterium]